MIKTLRGRLTAFNTAITGVILIAMTLFCLYVSEQDTRERAMQSFDSYMHTVSSYLSNQSAVSSDWLRQVESAGNISISIYDGGKPLYSMQHANHDLERQFQQVRSRAKAEYFLSADRIFNGKSCSFVLDGEGFIGGLAIIARTDSVIELMLLYSLEELEQAILQQRILVCIGEALALVLLWLFSWHFTRRMLQPIHQSQQRQIQFTAAASHELRTPLAAILSAASAAERADAGQRVVFLGQIQSEGQRMSRLIGDMLTLSGGDSENWTTQKSITDMEMLLLEAYESYLHRFREKGLTLSIHIPDTDIPTVSVDRERIYQVLTILLDNALSYTPVPGQIQMTLEQKKRSVRLLVSDTGPGIPDSEKKQVFQRFQRGEKARSDRSHFGLGLSIAEQIVKLHNGRIWVQDAAIGGAEFVVELPFN